MLEADAVDRVVELDVDAQVVAVEFQLVAGPKAAILVEVGFQRGDRTLEGERPVPVFFRRSLIVDRVGTAHGTLLDRQFNALSMMHHNAYPNPKQAPSSRMPCVKRH